MADEDSLSLARESTCERMQNANLVSLRAFAVAALLALAAGGCGSGKPSQASAPAKSVWDPFTIDVGSRSP
jgi:hypothetical protein